MLGGDVVSPRPAAAVEHTANPSGLNGAEKAARLECDRADEVVQACRPLDASTVGIDLYWLPLGAGGHSVRANGRVFEAVAARLARRPVRDLYHSALGLRLPEGRYVVELAPVPRGDHVGRGVVAEGAVGSRWAGRLRVFRYEVHCWLGGSIPDLSEAVASPQSVTNDPRQTQRLFDLVAFVPTPVWGRDQLGTGEMWNSNSVISWLIASSGLGDSFRPPAGGRAPGWEAGLVLAQRQTAGSIRRHGQPLVSVAT